MKQNTFRLYGDILNTWYHENERGGLTRTQIEISYKEYNINGDLVRDGSEDFSMQRYHKDNFQHRFVWVWNGTKRNAGGCRWFDCIGTVKYRHKDARLVKAYLKQRYNAADVELR